MAETQSLTWAKPGRASCSASWVGRRLPLGRPSQHHVSETTIGNWKQQARARQRIPIIGPWPTPAQDRVEALAVARLGITSGG